MQHFHGLPFSDDGPRRIKVFGEKVHERLEYDKNKLISRELMVVVAKTVEVCIMFGTLPVRALPFAGFRYSTAAERPGACKWKGSV